MLEQNMFPKLFRLIGAVLIFLTLPSASIAHKSSSESKKLVSAVSDLDRWNEKQKVKLLPHQLRPIRYLENNPDIHGLVIYHYLGTGKTYLALGFAERNQSKNIILLVPRFLITHWEKNMKQYGVANSSRYKIVPHYKFEKLIKEDFSNSIVIIDESHKIFDKMRTSDPSLVDKYSKLYLNMQKNAYKILSLSGTPIFGSNIDLAYQINLVSGKYLIPFNEQEFKLKYTTVKQARSAFRGHYVESLVASAMSGTFGSILSIPVGAMTNTINAVAVSTFPTLVTPIIKIFDKNMDFRKLDISKMKSIISKYISYYNFDSKSNASFPSKTLNYMKHKYNDYQIDILLRYADNKLNISEISQMLKDENISYGKSYILLNSNLIHDNLKHKPYSGLQISNLLHRKTIDSEIIYPDKFKKAYKLMQQEKSSIVVYSHFYYNGILMFAKYLDTMNEKGNYVILHPDDSVHSPAKYQKAIDDYNKGDIKFLLIHPEITEGISLIGTKQLHIFETPYNQSLQDQIIGRAIRFGSHLHLPEDERHVNVCIWRQSFGYFDVKHKAALRDNWYRNFPELNYYGEQSMIDKNSAIKNISPDQTAQNIKDKLSSELLQLNKFLQYNSIETMSGGVK